MENKISVFLTETDFVDAKLRLESATNLLKPFLQSLTFDQRIKLLKMSNKSIALMQELILNSKNGYGLRPNNIDLAEWEKDPIARQELVELYKICEQLCSKMVEISDGILTTPNAQKPSFKNKLFKNT